MLELAISGEPRFAVSRAELDREGPSYTVDTLERLAAPDGRPSDGRDELFLILGSDAIADFPRWKDPDRIAKLATLLVAERAGAPERAGDAPVVRFDSPRLDISSRELRARAARGLSLRYLVPDPVWKHIEARGLYRAEAPSPRTT
jgi:nicotinate-nucleotide adenylyltransferase